MATGVDIYCNLLIIKLIESEVLIVVATLLGVHLSQVTIGTPSTGSEFEISSAKAFASCNNLNTTGNGS
jgi:hypothetical protein